MLTASSLGVLSVGACSVSALTCSVSALTCSVSALSGCVVAASSSVSVLGVLGSEAEASGSTDASTSVNGDVSLATGASDSPFASASAVL